MRALFLLGIAASLAGCGGAPPTPTQTRAAGEAESTGSAEIPASAWRRVTLEPTTLSMLLPGEPTFEHFAPPWRDGLALSIVAGTRVGPVTFTAAVHDLAGRELADGEATEALIQGILTQAGATLEQSEGVRLFGAPGIDAVARMADGRVLLMRALVGRTRIYHPVIVGPAEAINHADIDRFFGSIEFDPDDSPWTPGDGVWSEGLPWSWVHPIAAGFSIEIQGSPAFEPLAASWPNVEGFELVVASADRTRAYRVRIWDFQGNVPSDALDTLLDRSRTDGTTISTPAPIMLRGVGGREWTLTSATTRTQVRAFITANALYEVSATAPLDAAAADAARFLDSFHLDGRCLLQ